MFNTRQFSYKIKKIYGVCLVTILPLWMVAFAQPLHIIQKNKTYWLSVRKDSLQKMVELKKLMPDLEYDLRYATPDNFTGATLYASGDQTFLRVAPAAALQKVANDLEKNGLGLKIFDAYRPYKVTVKMWELVHDERFVANPAKGSGHNRGLSVDLTLIDLETGKELDMGTGFDHFSDTAHHNFKSLSQPVLQNRVLLKKTLEKYGFKSLDTEWWHYSWPNDRDYQVLDIDFKKLRSK